MRLILASQSPRRLELLAQARRDARRDRARRHRRDPAEGRAADALCPARGGGEGGGGGRGRRADAGRRRRRRGRPAHPAQGRDRGRGALVPRLAVRPPPPRPLRRDADRRRRQGAPSPVDLDRRVQAARRGRDRRLSRQRRMARQSGRLCHPGPRRGFGPGHFAAPIRASWACPCSRPGRCSAPPAIRLAEWLYEEGIGENRAILVEDGAILEAAIELPGTLRAGAIVLARGSSSDRRHRRCSTTAARRWSCRRRASPKAPPSAPRSCARRSRKRGRPKPAKVRATDEALRSGPGLSERIGAPPPLARHGADRFEEAGWSELLDEAMTRRDRLSRRRAPDEP